MKPNLSLLLTIAGLFGFLAACTVSYHIAGMVVLACSVGTVLAVKLVQVNK